MVITFNGKPVEQSGFVEDTLGRSVTRIKGKCWGSPANRRDVGASKARHNARDNKVWSDGKWDLR